MAAHAIKNKFCLSTDLTNEASVESFFVLRLLAELGYADAEIKTKRAIQELKIARGRKAENYKPDFLIVCQRKPRWLIEAKATDEHIENFAYQGAAYSFQINRKYRDCPLSHYVLTNGLLTRVYVWDQEEPVLSLKFADFKDDHPKYQALRRLLGADAVRASSSKRDSLGQGPVLTRPTLTEVKRAFLRCHNMIHKGEKVSPQRAFVGFAKLLFVKLWEDRRLRDDPICMAAIAGGDPLPEGSVRFSTDWIAGQEQNEANPIDMILFRQLVEQLEAEIARKKRKRIFEPGERLNLSPGTVKRIVSELEDWYLFGIDEDLNGRMFEAFLAATMRGKSLGQYFTPRSIVKLISRLARPEASRKRVERVLDACCGTGGFLIEALTDMRQQVYANTSLTQREQAQLLNEIANEAIFGVDAGRDPPLARIARINMYLHGDGGSRVYVADALADPPLASPADPLEDRENVAELRELLAGGLRFDVVLTNPPFSMDYRDNDPDEAEILAGYELRVEGGRSRKSLRSAVMFIERYWRFLKPGGRLLTVIDDSVLGGKKADFVRDYIRSRFIIRGVISLHGDAFQRAGARVKTSVLYLERRSDDSEQPAAFVYETRYVGLDDVVPKTPPSVADEAKRKAAEEIDEVVGAFRAYMSGERGPWTVPAARLEGRIDAKYLRPWSVSELRNKWKRSNVSTELLEALVEEASEQVPLDMQRSYQFLRVSYTGRAERGETRIGREVGYRSVNLTKRDTIVVSHINAVNGSICVIPKDLEGLVVSSEYTVLRVRSGVSADPLYLWAVLRSAAVRAEFLSSSSGQGRHRVDWELLRAQEVPLLGQREQRSIGDRLRKALDYQREAARCEVDAIGSMSGLELDGDIARDRLERAKPPR